MQTALSEQDTRLPVSVTEAEAAILKLTEDIEMIQAQLSDRNQTDERGQRIGDHEYHQWRHRAVWAMKKKQSTLRRLKAWVKQANVEASRIEAGVERPANVVELVGAVLRLFKDAVDAEEWTPQERATVRLAEAFIRSKGVSAVMRARQAEEVAS